MNEAKQWAVLLGKSSAGATFLRKWGQTFEPRPLPKELERYRGELGYCYRNVLRAVLHLGPKAKYRYTEGFAGALAIVEHCWLTDAEGNAYELTWDDSVEKLGPASYFGVQFRSPYVKDHGYGGSLLWNRDNGFKLLRGVHKAERAIFWEAKK